mmetsp:Transcript_128948/g.223699  ORF Transcript_128948/g.223699 Transcript_128948/m.223699 type:complete len:638 (-) Transcript_128948:105-2018(-)
MGPRPESSASEAWGITDDFGGDAVETNTGKAPPLIIPGGGDLSVLEPTTQPVADITNTPRGVSGVRRPKWRLCFRMDKQASGSRMDNSMAWKHQRDFFVTVIDPPAPMSNHPLPPFFASEVACQIANLLVGRPFLDMLPGHSFENKAVAAVGKECLTAGLVAAMLGARTAFVAERPLLPHVQHNVRLYLKDTLDYTKTKSTFVGVSCMGRSGSLTANTLCDMIAAPSLDVAVVTESAMEACCVGKGNPFRRFEYATENALAVSRLVDILEDLVPPKAATRVLFVCDDRLGEGAGADSDDGMDPNKVNTSSRGGSPLPFTFELPQTWHARTFCKLLGRVPVVWIERMDADLYGYNTRKMLEPLRRYLPPMGAHTGVCGCGGHPQRNFLNHRVINNEWSENHARLKEALALHNRWKCGENAKVLAKAQAWGQTAGRQSVSAPAGYGPLGATSMLEHNAVRPGTVGDPRRTGGLDDGLGPLDFGFSEEDTNEGDAADFASCGSFLPQESGGSFQYDSETGDQDASASARLCDEWSTPDVEGSAAEVNQRSSTAPAHCQRPRGQSAAQAVGSSALPTLRPLRPPRSKKASRRPKRSYITGMASSSARSAKESTIAERHACPPHWYRCNRPCYGPLQGGDAR